MSDSSSSTRGGAASRALVVLAMFMIVCAGLRAGAELVVPFLCAVFLAIISLPPMAALHRAGLPKWASLAVVLVVVLAILVIFGWLLARGLLGFPQQLPRYQVILQQEISKIVDWLREREIDIPPEMVKEQLDASRILAYMGNFLTAMVGVAKTGFFVLLTWTFIIAEAAALPDKLHRAFGSSASDLSRYRGMMQDVQRYLAFKSGTNLLAALLVWFSCWLLGTPYALPLAIFAFFLNYVPVFGPIIAAVPAVLLTLAQGGPMAAMWMIVCQVALNVIVGSLIEPRLFGSRFGLSPLVVLLSLVFWGWLLGPVGMFLSVPLTMVAKILLANTREFRWLAVMLGTGSETIIAPDAGARTSASATGSIPR
ncbi:MAG: AI-2E family transporter [Phycisphaeraceae bacterium]|nr:AI-2E family transporter [Phycisphaeraceae bacterium]